MITPNIAPRRIMRPATIGLFSAAKSSIRRVENTTNAISKAPSVTKEQKFGVNYVQFFGSKKNSKILKKSLQSIRDSLVATFKIAKLLRSEVSKNVKLIGEKTKGKRGFFGLGLGGILGIINLLTNPIILGALGIGAGILGGKFLFDFLKNNRGQIIEFILNKTKGLYNTLQGLVVRILRDFFGDRFKEPETRNLEIESENRIEAEMDDILEKDEKADKRQFITRAEARKTATDNELQRLEERKNVLENKSKTSKEDDELDAIRKRIKQLTTGENVFDKKPSNPVERFARDFFQKEFQREPVFLRDNQNYLKLSREEKLKKIKGLVGNFRSKGNSMDRIKEIYTRAINSGELSESQKAQAVDIVNYADRDDAATRAKRKKNEQDPNITPDNFSFSTDLEAGAFSDGSGLDGNYFDVGDVVDPERLANKDIANSFSDGSGLDGNYFDVGGGDYRHLDQIKRMYKDPRGKQKYGGKMMRNVGDIMSDLDLASNPVSGKSKLTQVPVQASSSPTCPFHSNLDIDNDLPGFNRSLLCIT